MRVIVTGAAGFIGANIIAGINALGIDDVIAVDDLTDGAKFKNLLGCQIADYIHKDDFYDRFANGAFGKVEAVFHEGACSDTMEHDGRFMLDNNYRCSKNLLDACAATDTRLLYASSAATYGGGSTFIERPEYERPLNVYGYSKLLFDNVVRRSLPALKTQIAGFRYFNVYGPHEQHKGRMASVAFHHFNQMRTDGRVRLFGGHDGYAAGEQRRDFVFVDDVVAVKIWFFQNPQARGIFNLGTGRAESFNEVAHSVINALRRRGQQDPMSLIEQLEAGLIEYVAFPDALKGKYQSFTQADAAALRTTGCTHQFATVATGVSLYVDWLCENADL